MIGCFGLCFRICFVDDRVSPNHHPEFAARAQVLLIVLDGQSCDLAGKFFGKRVKAGGRRETDFGFDCKRRKVLFD
jgi:hypothetical protein